MLTISKYTGVLHQSTQTMATAISYISDEYLRPLHHQCDPFTPNLNHLMCFYSFKLTNNETQHIIT